LTFFERGLHRSTLPFMQSAAQDPALRRLGRIRSSWKRARRAPLLRRALGVRLGALAMVALFALGQLGSLAHFALVRHTRCADHGELVESGAPASAATSTSTPTGDPARGLLAEAHRSLAALTSAEPGSEGADHHDHCSVAIHRRDAACATGQRPALSAAPRFIAAETPLQRGFEVTGHELLRLAPKTSPPA
jgi:hypothetical protein